VKPNAFSRRKRATKPPFSRKRNRRCRRNRKSKHKREREREIDSEVKLALYQEEQAQKRERERERKQRIASNEYSRMHSVEESLLRSRHSVGSETDTAVGRERERERDIHSEEKPVLHQEE
jgi:hypothetical protein